MKPKGKRKRRWNPLAAPVFGCSCQGTFHKLQQIPCQDAWTIVKSKPGKIPGLILGAGDGHGAAVHDLSEQGSRLAMRAVEIVLEKFLSRLTGPSTEDDRFYFRIAVPQELVSCWYNLVLEDAQERGLLKPDSEDLLRQKIIFRYGTTCLGCLVTSHEIFILSIGDGDIVFVKPDGSIGLHLEQDAPDLPGTMTYSLASYEPQNLFQVQILDREKGGMIFLTTDGLSNSFVKFDYFLEFATALQERIREDGFHQVTESLPTTLDYISEHGSGDDITFVLAWIEDPSEEEEQLIETHHVLPLKGDRTLEMDGKQKTNYEFKEE